MGRRPLALTQETAETWLVRSRLPVNPQEAKPQGSSWPPRLPGSLRHPPEVSRSPIATGPAQSLSVRSGVTRSPPSCSSASCPSRGWSGRLLRLDLAVTDHPRYTLWTISDSPLACVL